MKKIINISLILTLNILLLTGCSKKNVTNDNNQNNEQIENQENISENTTVIGNQTIGSITFEITSLKCENEKSILEYSITNQGKDELVMSKYKVLIYDDNRIIYEFNRNHKNDVLDPNETKIMKKEIKKDLTKATSINFELIEEENR